MKSIKYIIPIILFTFSINSCKNNQENESITEDEQVKESNEIRISKEQFQDTKMELGSISEQDFPETIKTSGMIDVPPTGKEVITSFYGGNIKQFKLIVGDKVRKGQALVSIENPIFIDLQQEYLEIKAQINYLQSEYERQKTLFNENIASEKNFLKAESEFKSQQSKLYGLKKKLQMLNINVAAVEQRKFVSSITLSSTINGFVSDVNIAKGMHIVPEHQIMKIVSTDHIHVELSVFEKDILKVKKGQAIKFQIPEASDQFFEASVHLIGIVKEEKTNIFKVHGHLVDEKENNFNIGMFVEAEITTDSKKSMALPENSIIKKGEDFVLLKLKSTSNEYYFFELITVKTGATNNGFIEITSKNITKEDQILIKEAYSLINEED